MAFQYQIGPKNNDLAKKNGYKLCSFTLDDFDLKKILDEIARSRIKIEI